MQYVPFSFKIRNHHTSEDDEDIDMEAAISVIAKTRQDRLHHKKTTIVYIVNGTEMHLVKNRRKDSLDLRLSLDGLEFVFC